jgi:hypothetical protein
VSSNSFGVCKQSFGHSDVRCLWRIHPICIGPDQFVPETTREMFANTKRTPTASLYCFPSVKFKEKMSKPSFNSLGILQTWNPPHYSPPPACEYWQAQPPRKSARDPCVNPYHPSPRAKIQQASPTVTEARVVGPSNQRAAEENAWPLGGRCYIARSPGARVA